MGKINSIVLFASIFSIMSLGVFGSQDAFAGFTGNGWVIKNDENGGDCEGNYSGNGPIPGAVWTPTETNGVGTTDFSLRGTCTLTQDLPDSMGISFASRGSTLDGNGHSMSPPEEYICSFDGVLVNYRQTTVQNLEVFNWYNGIKVDSVNDVSVLNNNSHDNCNHGIKFKNQDRGVAEDNKANRNGNTGIFIRDSSATTVEDNKANTNCNIGITFEDVWSSQIINNDANKNGFSNSVCNFRADSVNSSNDVGAANGDGGIGIYLYESGWNNVEGNEANNNHNSGIILDYSHNNNVQANTVTSNDFTGIGVFSGNGNGHNFLTENVATKNSVGISLGDTDNNFLGIRDTSFDPLSVRAVENGDGPDCTDDPPEPYKVAGNFANDNAVGILLTFSDENCLIKNTANLNTDDGFFFLDSVGLSTSDRIEDGDVSITDDDSPFGIGIFLISSGFNSLVKNSAIGNDQDGILLIEDFFFCGPYGCGQPGSVEYDEDSEGNSLIENTANNNGEDGIDNKESLDVFDDIFATNHFDSNLRDFCEEELGRIGNYFFGNTADGNDDDGYDVEDSDCNVYENNVASNNGDEGFDVGNSDYNAFTGNTAEDNDEDGFDNNPDSDFNEYTCNYASGNRHGFEIDDADGNLLDGNTSEENQFGLFFITHDVQGGSVGAAHVDDNTIEDNNFINNVQADIGTEGDAFEDNTFFHNYYTDHDEASEGCTDNDVDGRCDADYEFDNGDLEFTDRGAQTKPQACDDPEESEIQACVTTGAILTLNEGDPNGNIGLVVPGVDGLGTIGDDVPSQPTVAGLTGIAKTSDGTTYVTGEGFPPTGDAQSADSPIPYIAEVDVNTGEFVEDTFHPTTSGEASSRTIIDLAVQPGTDVLFAVVDENDNLYTVDPETGEMQNLGPIFPGFSNPAHLGQNVFPAGIGFRSDGALFAIVALTEGDSGMTGMTGVTGICEENEEDVGPTCHGEDTDNWVMLELEVGEGVSVERTMDIEDEDTLNGFEVCPDGTFMFSAATGSTTIGVIDPVTGELIETSSTTQTIGDIIFEPATLENPGGAGTHEPPTIGKSLDGLRQVVQNGICIDSQCWTVSQPYHQEFELLQMLTSPHTISNTIFCNQGVQQCNYIAVGFMPIAGDFTEPTMLVSASRAFQGPWTISVSDPEDYIYDPSDDAPQDVTFTSQEIDNKLLGTSFTIDFKNKDTGQLKLGIQVRDDKGGVRNHYFNEGVMFMDADAYPKVAALYDTPLSVEKLCIGADPDYRHSCSFAKKKAEIASRAQEILQQINDGTYVYEQ